MRLSEIEQQTTKESISAFDKQAKIVLFGSRAREQHGAEYRPGTLYKPINRYVCSYRF